VKLFQTNPNAVRAGDDIDLIVNIGGILGIQYQMSLKAGHVQPFDVGGIKHEELVVHAIFRAQHEVIRNRQGAERRDQRMELLAPGGFVDGRSDGRCRQRPKYQPRILPQMPTFVVELAE